MKESGNDEIARNLANRGKFEEAIQVLKRLEHDSKDPIEIAGYLLNQADCYVHCGATVEARACIGRTRTLAGSDSLAAAQIDFFEATLLLEAGRREQGLIALSSILERYPSSFSSNEGRELYERIQVQRGFTLMHISRYEEGLPILEEALSFQLAADVMSSVHCHLGRRQCELGRYRIAGEHFTLAQNLGVPEDWETTFHYYYGYALYELREFDAAGREFLLSLQTGEAGPPLSYKYRMLAQTYRKLGEHSRARKYEELARENGE